jgi:hypothetical protein
MNSEDDLIEYFIKKLYITSGVPKKYLYPDPLDSINFNVILKYVRKKKLYYIKNNKLNDE